MSVERNMTPDPETVAQFDAITWHYLPENEETVIELEERLLKAAVGKRARPVVYSDWVRCGIPGSGTL